jgi:hypothetical protein
VVTISKVDHGNIRIIIKGDRKETRITLNPTKQGEEKMSKNKSIKIGSEPRLCFEDSYNGNDVQIAFGNVDNEPTAIVFVAKSGRYNKHMPEEAIAVTIPKEALGVAFQQGWEE